MAREHTVDAVAPIETKCPASVEDSVVLGVGTNGPVRRPWLRAMTRYGLEDGAWSAHVRTTTRKARTGKDVVTGIDQSILTDRYKHRHDRGWQEKHSISNRNKEPHGGEMGTTHEV